MLIIPGKLQDKPPKGITCGYNDLISNKREWNNCFIKTAQKNCNILSSPAVFVDAYRLRNLWSMVYELMYHCLLANQNSGIAIFHCQFLIIYYISLS